MIIRELIISRELPPEISEAAKVADSIVEVPFDAIKREFADAQKQAIVRFCAAVEQRAHTAESSYMTAHAWRDALWQLRDSLEEGTG